jgi:hypothetical protein
MKDVDGDNARGKTNKSGERDEAPVVFAGKAGKYAEH